MAPSAQLFRISILLGLKMVRFSGEKKWVEVKSLRVGGHFLDHPRTGDVPVSPGAIYAADTLNLTGTSPVLGC